MINSSAANTTTGIPIIVDIAIVLEKYDGFTDVIFPTTFIESANEEEITPAPTKDTTIFPIESLNIDLVSLIISVRTTQAKIKKEKIDIKIPILLAKDINDAPKNINNKNVMYNIS